MEDVVYENKNYKRTQKERGSTSEYGYAAYGMSGG